MGALVSDPSNASILIRTNGFSVLRCRNVEAALALLRAMDSFMPSADTMHRPATQHPVVLTAWKGERVRLFLINIVNR